MQTATGAGFFDRETWGYGVPVLDPDSITHPSEVSFAAEDVGTNVLLALLIALVFGVSGAVLSRLLASDEAYVRRILGRLPFQALLTVALLWLLGILVPGAAAQGVVLGSSPSLVQIPLYALAFFLVVGGSNALFNNLLSVDNQGIFGGLQLSGRAWFIVLLVVGYGIVGAHVNPDFSLLPGRELGIALVATLSIIVTACFKDAATWTLTRVWRMPGRFKANIAGFSIAVACIALTRWMELSPGYIYGVPVGLLIAARAYAGREGPIESLGILWTLLFALAMWFLSESLVAYPVLFDLCTLLFVILVEDAFLEMLPLPQLPGGTIFAWRKPFWLVLFLVTIFFLLHTLFHPQGTVAGLVESPPTAATLLLIGCYVVGVFLLWAWVTWTRQAEAR